MMYIVQAAWANDKGEVEIPRGARILNAFYHPVTGALGVALLIRPEPEPEPEDASEKETKKEG